MLIRRMRDGDVEAAVALALACYDGVLAEHHSAEVLAGFRAEVTPEAFREQMSWKEAFVAEEDGEVVATGALADFGEPGAPRYAVSQFYVRPDRHGRGVGALLLEHIVAQARESGAPSLHVPSSRNAVPFYARAGFGVDAEQPDAAVEITWMTLPLSALEGRRARRPGRG